MSAKDAKQEARSLGEFADEQAAAKFAEHEAIVRKYGAQIRGLKSELSSEREKVVTAEAELGAAEKALSFYKRQYDERPEWLLPPKEPKPGRATIIPLLSDVHTGEVVRPAEMGDYNKYDLRICELRLQRFFRGVIEQARSWSAFRYDGCFLAMPGDFLSGDIHDELTQTNECSSDEAVFWVVPRISEGIDLLRKEFKHVHVASAPGNHPRDSKIPRYKKRSAHNADTLIARLVAREFSKVEGVTFEIPESLDANVRVYRFDFSLEHGDELIKTFSGSAEIGFLGPLVRGTNRKRNAYATEGKGLDYALWGHGHQLIPVPSRGFIANGSVKGYDEYARGKKFRPEPAQQALMVCVPDFGITTQTPVILTDRAAEAW